MKIALFDVDRTLLSSPLGADTRRFSECIYFVHGRGVEVIKEEIDGLTDRLILKYYLYSLGITEYRFDEMFEAMYAVFIRTLPERGYFCLAGIPELLEELKKKGVLIGHVTGNIRKIALDKMKAVGIGGFFTFGGYGCSVHSSRHELVARALEDCARVHGKLPETPEIFLFGDTLRDIAAGKTAGVKTIGVGTGSFSAEQLKEAGADLAVEDLKNGLSKVFHLIFSQ